MFSPDDELQGGIRLILELFVAQLPPEQKRLLTRVYFQGRSLLQASYACRNIPLGEARVLLAQARRIRRWSALSVEQKRLWKRVFLWGQTLPEAARCARDIPYATAHALHTRALLGLRRAIEANDRYREIFEEYLALLGG